MTNQIRANLIVLVLICIAIHVNAQKKDILTSLSVGMTTPVVDNGSGLYLGLNISHPTSPQLSLEGQLSYMKVDLMDSFFSRNDDRYNTINALLGLRTYFNKEDRKTRCYLSFLIGAGYLIETSNRFGVNRMPSLGYALGGTIEFNQTWIFGLSFEGPQNIVLKVGYIF